MIIEQPSASFVASDPDGSQRGPREQRPLDGQSPPNVTPADAAMAMGNDNPSPSGAAGVAGTASAAGPCCQPPPWLKVPIKGLLIGLLVVVVAATALVAFLPIYLQGVEASRDLVEIARFSSAALAHRRVSEIFETPVRELLVLEHVFKQPNSSFAPPHSTVDHRFYYDLLCGIVLGSPLGRPRSVSVTIPALVVGSFCDSLLFKTVFFFTSYDNATRQYVGYFNGTLVNYDAQTPSYDEYTSNPAFLAIAARPLDAPERWVPLPFLGLQGFLLSVGVRIVHPDPVGSVYVRLDVATDHISTILADLGLRSGYRCFVLHRATGFVLGTSWGEPAAFIIPGTSQFLNDGSIIERRLDNFTDATVRALNEAFGGAAAFNTTDLPRRGDFVMSSIGRVFYDVVPVRDALGLDLVLGLALPEEDYLGDVYRLRWVVIAAVAGALAAVLAIAIALALALSQPIVDMARRMERTSQLQDDGLEGPLSALAEISEMQTAYFKMRAQLNLAKRYLPASVVQGLLADSSGEHVLSGDDDDEGDMEQLDVSMMGGSRQVPANLFSNPPSQSGSSFNSASGSLRGRSPRLAAAGLATASPSEVGVSSSFHSHTTTSSSGRVHPQHGGAKLNLLLNLTQRRICIVYLNVSNWHDLVRRHGTDGGQGPTGSLVASCGTVLADYVNTVTRCARRHRGVVDYFQGDRIVLSFNAVSASANFVSRGVSAAHDAHVYFATTDPARRMVVTAGISAGPAVVGNAGGSEQLRFLLAGAVYSEAAAVERYGRNTFRAPAAGSQDDLYDHVSEERRDFTPTPAHELHHRCPYTLTPVFATSSVVQETEAEFSFQYVDIMELRRPAGHSEARCRRRGVVASVERSLKLTAAADEWMYAMQANKAVNPFRSVNCAFLDLLTGDKTPEDIMAGLEQGDAPASPQARIESFAEPMLSLSFQHDMDGGPLGGGGNGGPFGSSGRDVRESSREASPAPSVSGRSAEAPMVAVRRVGPLDYAGRRRLHEIMARMQSYEDMSLYAKRIF